MPRSKSRKGRPLLRNGPTQHNRPPGLKGREIGLYYKHLSQQKKANKKKEDDYIHLRIPQQVIVGIYNCLDKIERIAKKRNIYIAPVKQLEFVKPVTNLDFIPIVASDAEKLMHSITNIRKRDEDVIFVKKEPEMAIEISDSDSEVAAQDTEEKSTTTELDNDGIFVSNNYIKPSTSTGHDRASHRSRSNHQGSSYKFSYDDIITGTFQEKLDECISKGIDINMRNSETNHISDDLKNKHQDMLMFNEKYKEMLKFRETLPTYKKAKDLLDIISSNQVVVISGETGCGKSTQVPQLILDEAIAKGRGANVKVLVTEPRRIAASSLAARVAEERGECLGNSVGYAVRLESVQCRDQGSIMFCTTGVLLVELETNQALSAYSHVILDEVHERDCHVDLAMCLLRQILKKRKDLKVILMSATIDAEAISSYYDNCPMVHIEGLAFPVKDVYLEEILGMIEFQLPPRPNFQDKKGTKAWCKHTQKGRAVANEMEKELQYKASIAPWLNSVKKDMDPKIFNLISDYRIEEINLSLLLKLLIRLCRGEPGAILVFLPGISEISKLIKMMNQSLAFPETTHEIYALHSKLPTIDQNRIFKKPPSNVRKIIVATNIAETSITIDDIVYVIDCGKLKYKGLNVDRNISTLEVEWESKANLRQRRGRAGRCQPGICYHLVTTHRAELLPDRLLPELQRSDLLEEVLCIKKLRLGKAEEALNMMPAVPADKTMQWAVRHLQYVGALDENETLTPLGWHLARLPVHPAAGKLLLLGALFGCLDRAASVAAVWGFKDPFQFVISKEQEVNEVKREFAMGEPSDHIAMAEAIIQWEQCESYGKRHFAYEKFLSYNTLKLLSDMKRQFADNLKQMGFLHRADVKSTLANRNHDNLSLFKAIVAAALYPNIATVRWQNEKLSNPNRPILIKTFTPEDGKVSLHPSSVMHTKEQRGAQTPLCLNTGANWLVYWLKRKSTDLFLIDVTCVYTLPLLFFGDLNFTRAPNPDECLISISSYKVCCKKETAQLLFQLRSLLDQVLTSKISRSLGDCIVTNSEFDEEVLGAVTDLITAEDEGTQYLCDNYDDDQYDALSSGSDTDSVNVPTHVKWNTRN